MPNALVTGASRGLGRATCESLARAGWTVTLTARDPVAGKAVADVLGVGFAALDVADPASVERVAASIGSLDLLVNNAAIYDDADRARVFATNVYGAVRVSDALAPLVRDGGAVLFVSSAMGELSGASRRLRERLLARDLDRAGWQALLDEPGWHRNEYSASKAAINGFARVFAREQPRLRVNAVCPGWVRTDMGGAGAPRSIAQGVGSIVAAASVSSTGGFWRDGQPLAW